MASKPTFGDLCRLCLLSLGGFLIAACSPQATISQLDCNSSGDMQPICQFSNPEDLLLLPDGESILVSEYGTYFDANPGALAIYNTKSNQTYKLPALTELTEPKWGQEDCTTPPGPAWSPHGLDLSVRSDGALQLLVVNHAPEERIEFIELTRSEQQYQALWRGCVQPPANSYINSVASTPNSGLVMTHMFPKDSPTIGTTSLAVALSALGKPSGYVIQWDAQTNQFKNLKYSTGGFPNGVLISPKGHHMYVAYSTDNKVVKFDRQTGEVIGEVKVAHPDNLRWDQQGSILVAGMPVSGLEAILCQEASREGKQCAGAFEIHRINPTEMKAEKIIAHDGTAPMGSATVAIQVDESIYIGSFAGNRILKVKQGY